MKSVVRFRVVGASRWKGKMEGSNEFIDSAKLRVLVDLDTSRNSADEMKWGQDVSDLRVPRQAFDRVEHLMQSLPVDVDVEFERKSDGKGGFKEVVTDVKPVDLAPSSAARKAA